MKKVKNSIGLSGPAVKPMIARCRFEIHRAKKYIEDCEKQIKDYKFYIKYQEAKIKAFKKRFKIK